jgi:hypothetical protein
MLRGKEWMAKPEKVAAEVLNPAESPPRPGRAAPGRLSFGAAPPFPAARTGAARRKDDP